MSVQIMTLQNLSSFMLLYGGEVKKMDGNSNMNITVYKTNVQ